MDRRTLPCDLVSCGFHRLSFLYDHQGLSARSVFEPFPPGLFTSWLPRSVLFFRRSLPEQPCQHSPSPTRAGERNLLTTAFSEFRHGSRRCVLLTAVLSARHLRCYFRLRLLALPQPLAFRLALCRHLSVLRLIDSSTCLATNTRHTMPMLFPAPFPDHSVFGYWQINYTVSVRPQPKPRPVTTVHRKYL